MFILDWIPHSDPVQVLFGIIFALVVLSFSIIAIISIAVLLFNALFGFTTYPEYIERNNDHAE